ncbi:MAG: MarR family transcriptional regulator [Nitrospirales bacterium]|nr:MarR family transcriptional regulator [Nitrospirales bacterium]
MKTNPLNLTQYLEPAQACVCFHLRKTARVITQRYDEALRPIGLRATQFPILVAARLTGAITINRLAEELIMDRTTLTRNLKPLKKDGLILVSQGQSDQREREVTLTVTGQARLAKALPLWKTVQQQVTKELGQARVDRLLEDLSATIDVARPE